MVHGAGEWFHTGDLAVMHKDGSLELKDRSKALPPCAASALSAACTLVALSLTPNPPQARTVGRHSNVCVCVCVCVCLCVRACVRVCVCVGGA